MATYFNPLQATLNESPIFPNSNQTSDEFRGQLDENWAKVAFMIGDNNFSIDVVDPASYYDVRNRYWSSADAKYTDSRLGGNIGINTKPQWTRYSDIRRKGRRPDIKDVSPYNVVGPFGAGRAWGESIDDNEQRIYIRAGVPQYNSLFSFVRNAFDPGMQSIAKSGKASPTAYNIGNTLGTISAVVAFPAVAATVFAGKAFLWLFSRPISKFYTLKPTMGPYWSTVNSLANNIAVSLGLFPKILDDTDPQKGQRLGQPYVFDTEYLKSMAEMMPDGLINENGYFDIYAIAGRAQRIANKAFMSDYEKLNRGTASDFTGYLYKQLSGDGTHTTDVSDADGNHTFMSYIARAAKFGYYASQTNDSGVERDPRAKVYDQDNKESADPASIMADQNTAKETIGNFFDAEASDGSQFAVFCVDHTGSVGESWSTSVGESDVSSKLNGMASQVRQMSFSFADGNIIGNAVTSAMGAMTDFATGALSGFTFGLSDAVAGLIKGGYIDIPKVWQSSSFNLPTINYKMRLMSPYGNPISQMMDIYIPLSMILSLIMPRSVGKASYYSPYLVQVFDRGRQQIKLGMMQSLTVERGVSDLGFNAKGRPLAVDVSFSFVDMSSIMHMPISTGSIFEADSALDEDNILADYIAVLAGQDMYSQLYAIPKAKMRAAKWMMSTQKLYSPAFWASTLHESLTVGLINDLTLGVTGVATSIIEGASRGSAVMRQNTILN